MGGAVGAGLSRVLFVGNSFTYFHNLPQQLAVLARPEVEVVPRMIAAGGAILGETWPTGPPAAALRAGTDFVVLQEQSMLGGGVVVDDIPRPRDPADFHSAVRTAVADIRAAGAVPALYLTWARRDDPEAQEALTDAYVSIGSELDVAVVPVGLAWQAALSARPEFVLHDEDESHPAPAGSYLAACVFLKTLFNLDPRGRARNISGVTIDSEGAPGEDGTLIDLSATDAAFLQDIAWRTTC
ncbi:hypothetical protein [Actinokineospora inagensis]|uniref:hypothetical protein n=1 Tax=Actinokineospora inagensis TaxID=103730 RepID=UPI000428C0F1|nr:hypothetical protein [Actinokineospora inagensis]